MPIIYRNFLQFLSLCFIFILLSCASKGENASNNDELIPKFGYDGVLDWNDLATSRSDGMNSNEDDVQNISVQPYKAEQLHPKIKKDRTLSRLTLNRSLSDPEPYEGGVYGKIGSAVYFGSSTENISNYNRLYWVQVKVLSEKFGCFMRKKVTRGDINVFFCRDNRRVVYWRAASSDWIQFHARQFDSSWRELIVSDGRIIEKRPLYSKK